MSASEGGAVDFVSFPELALVVVLLAGWFAHAATNTTKHRNTMILFIGGSPSLAMDKARACFYRKSARTSNRNKRLLDQGVFAAAGDAFLIGDDFGEGFAAGEAFIAGDDFAAGETDAAGVGFELAFNACSTAGDSFTTLEATICHCPLRLTNVSSA